ncbi:MAG TPA: tetratricopeptide repeat protein [Gallionella sp.]|nr:tetratricopeptide repeat protein [Gallionella sp.]
MIRAALMLVLLAIAFPAAANSTWSRLWLTPDQRAEKLLQQGDASAAAKEYQDPRRKAYAEMKAGNFKQAASDLGKLHDSDSEYNRGNALAKMGDLKGALDAYDAALKSEPKNHDAQHNRDLVEKAMKQQQQQKNGQSKNDKSGGKQGNKQGANSAGQGKQGNQSGNSANGANNPSGKQSQSAGKNSSQSGKSGGNAGAQNSAAAQNAQQGSGKNQAQTTPQNNPGQSGSAAAQSQGKQAGQSGRNGQASAAQQHAASSDNSAGQTPAPAPAKGLSPDDAAQARQDAAASLAANKGKQGAGGNETANINAAPVDQTAPLSEQQLSKEQWLRSIPDDPGGLLRRKFMIEYMLRQQKAQQ